jgi:dienelactone hydrolase
LSEQFIEYHDEGQTFEAFVAFPKQNKKAPLVILCHSWSGRDAYICEKAQLIAEWGYVGFALDLYGKGIIGKSPAENAALKKPLLDDRKLLNRRLLKAFEVASTFSSNQIATLGFGFGGLCALDLARSGAPLKGAVSIYGHFEPSNLPKKPISAKILILHGYDDPIVPPSDLQAFSKEMTESKVDWQAHLFGATLHAFTNPHANRPDLGMAYHPTSTERALSLTLEFLEEIFVR